MNEPVVAREKPLTPAASAAEGVGGARGHRGPATVINPERRAAAVAASATPATANSSVARLLFPPEGEEQSLELPMGEPGVQLGHFQIVERIRSGGMGSVFRALDLRLNRSVALKVLPPVLSRDPLVVQRFRNEAQAAALLDHENIARVYYFGEERGLHFIAFEFVTGTNVRELIQQQGRLPIADAVNYALQIATALVHTSVQGVVHRDIKPSNIIISTSGRAKLVDLGLARKENREDGAAELTMAGTTLGTFDYISPEQARDPRTADIRSDIYSLGCTLYHMLTGSPPFPEGTVLQKLLQHQGDDAPDPAENNPAISADLSAVVRKMMAKDQRARYQQADQLVRDLMLIASAMGLRSVHPEGLVWVAPRPEKSSFWQRHLAWMATAAVLLGIVGYLEYAPSGGAAGPATSSWMTGAGSEDPTASRDDSTSAPLSGQGGSRSEASGASSPADRSPNSGGSELAETGRSPVAIDDGDDLEGEPDDGDNDAAPPSPFRHHNLAEVDRSAAEGRSSPGPSPDFKTSSGAIVRTPPGRRPNPEEDDDPEPVDERVGAATEEPAVADRSTSDNRQDEGDAPEALADADGIFLLGRDNSPPRRFASLEAACSEIRDNGAVIELRFDGRRVESGLKINRKVEIRAAPGYRPLIELRPSQVVTDGRQARGISISSGSLDLMGVDLEFHVDDATGADQWSVFSIERPEALRLENVTLTLVNPRFRLAALIELRPGAGANMPDMPAVGVQPRPPLEIEVSRTLVRGQGDLFLVRQGEPVRLNVRQSVVAIQGAMLAVRGLTEAPPEGSQIELRLDHVTAVMQEGLIRVEGGPGARKQLPMQVQAADNIFSSSGNSPLVTMTGGLTADEFHKLLVWNGKNNIYDRYESWWSVASNLGAGMADEWDFAAWRRLWTDAGESNPRQVDAGIWRRGWTRKPLTELVGGDFSLDLMMPRNPAVSGATFSSDAGANLAIVPQPSAVPMLDHSRD
ncbi:MAG: protein kinase domain-containing protein [Planctomycetales bacterium]